MGLLEHFKVMRDKVHPAAISDSPAPSLRAVGTPSKQKPSGPTGWHKCGGYPNPPLPPPAAYGRPRRKSSYSSSSSSGSFCYCLSFLFSFLVILLILAGLTALIIYVVFQPKLPKATVQNVAITMLNVTNHAGGPVSSLADLHAPVLNANIAFTIQVENPNEKLGIHFRDVSIIVAYNGTEFAHSFVPPFFQAKKTRSEVVADLKASSAPMSESQGRELQAAINKHDVPLSARIRVGAALQIGRWVIPPIHIRVGCDVRASPPTAPQGAKLLSKECRWLR